MYEYRVKEVVRIVDGDTVDLILDLGFGLFKKERVRIAGVDTPEKRTRNLKEKKLGYDATSFVEGWFAEDGDIVVRTEKDGKYGRLLGWIYRGEKCLNHEIIDGGWGWVYLGGTKIDTNDMESLLLLLKKRGYDTWENYSEANP